MKPKTFLITGASGFLGSNFCQLYSRQYNLHGTYRLHEAEIPGVSMHPIDLANEEKVAELLEEVRPDGILHLAALSDANLCEQEPDHSMRDNVETAEILSAAASERNIRFLFASTDLVFDGKRAPYNEKDLPSPISIYGTHKAIAEEAVRDNYKHSVICRLPLMYGSAYSYGKSFLQPSLEKLRKGGQLKLFTDEYRSVASARNICEGLLTCFLGGEGIYHLGGPERLSRFEIGEKICEVFSLDKSLLIPAKSKEVLMPAPRPEDVSMTSKRAIDLGWIPRTITEELTTLLNLHL